MAKSKNINNVEDKKKVFSSFLKFKDKAIDSEEGENFHLNIPEKNIQFFHNGYSFCAFKIMKIEGVNTCYVYYMYKDDEDSFKKCYYGMINYCLGNNVKFIFYSEKEKKTNFYFDFLSDLGYNSEKIQRRYAKNFKCKKCGGDNASCTCNTINYYI